MRVELDTKQMYATGVSDTLGNRTRPVFVEGGSTFTMDTILYNFKSGKAKIKGVATQEGEALSAGRRREEDAGQLHQHQLRQHNDLRPDRPSALLPRSHQGEASSRRRKSSSVRPTSSWGGRTAAHCRSRALFPLTQGRSSGIIIPSYGEETTRGFFLRDGGYYWAASEHMDPDAAGQHLHLRFVGAPPRADTYSDTNTAAGYPAVTPRPSSANRAMPTT